MGGSSQRRTQAVLTAALTVAMLMAGCSDTPTPADEPTAGDDAPTAQVGSGSGVIRGVVVDDKIAPVEGATVAIAGRDIEPIITDAEGTFRFEGAEPGAYFLEVAKSGYLSTTVQAHVGTAKEPAPALKVVLEALAEDQPYFVQDQAQMRIECATGTVGIGFNACGAPGIMLEVVCNGGSGVPPTGICLGSPFQDVNYYLEFAPVATFIQSELYWEPSSSAGDATYLYSFAFEKGNRAPADRTQLTASYGPSPLLVARINSTEAAQHSLGGLNGTSYNIIASGTDETVNVILQQDYELFTTIFYNFAPDEEWTFVEQGPPVIP